MDDVTLFIRESDVRAFRDAFRKRYGVELDDITAKHELTRLVRLVALVCTPTTEGLSYEPK